jgi:hypothetical protein
VITLSSGQGVPENWISALEAGGGNNMHQASHKLNPCRHLDEARCIAHRHHRGLRRRTTPFADVEDWRRFYEGLPKPEKRVHFVAVGSSADKAKMEKFAAVSKGAFLYIG